MENTNLNGATITAVSSGQSLVTNTVGQTTTDWTIDNIASVITSSDSFNVDENTDIIVPVYDADATDNVVATDVGITHSLTGTDASLFTIDADNGEARFNSSPDYETQSAYSIDVVAMDAAGNEATQAVTVNVNDVDEIAPVNTVVVDEVIVSLPTIAGETSGSSVEVKLDLDGDGVYDESGERTYAVIPENDGSWMLDLASAVADGDSAPLNYSVITADTLGVQVTDAAGKATVKTETLTKQDSSYSISDSRVIEGETGTKTMTFMVTRAGDFSSTGSVDYAVDTMLSSAKTGSGVENDYTGTANGTVTFAAGESFKEITLTVNGDYYKEVNENIIMKLSNPTGVAVSKDTGVGELTEVDTSAMSAAFSLRDINSDLVTNVLRVRRSLDDAEMDIGFDKYGNLDTDALLKFVNNNDTSAAAAGATGYVKIWYGQSSREKNLIQTNDDKQGCNCE